MIRGIASLCNTWVLRRGVLCRARNWAQLWNNCAQWRRENINDSVNTAARLHVVEARREPGRWSENHECQQQAKCMRFANHRSSMLVIKLHAANQRSLTLSVVERSIWLNIYLLFVILLLQRSKTNFCQRYFKSFDYVARWKLKVFHSTFGSYFSSSVYQLCPDSLKSSRDMCKNVATAAKLAQVKREH